MANRIEKINEEAKKEISLIIRELKDPRITKGLCSIVSVDITKDLRWCKAYVSVFGDEDVKNGAMEGLKNASGFVRRELAQRLKLRYTPEIIFNLDNSIEHGAHINKLLRGLENDLKR
ncbi:MAG: 30S ribosome-binding factor RbfA [Clostridia bacterium]|nr:30S ribosome-binding factor RbfA [Clostridia bacterium]